jgi:hypothetical protein
MAADLETIAPGSPLAKMPPEQRVPVRPRPVAIPQRCPVPHPVPQRHDGFRLSARQLPEIVSARAGSVAARERRNESAAWPHLDVWRSGSIRGQRLARRRIVAPVANFENPRWRCHGQSGSTRALKGGGIALHCRWRPLAEASLGNGARHTQRKSHRSPPSTPASTSVLFVSYG